MGPEFNPKRGIQSVGVCKIPLYFLFVVTAIFSHAYNVRVGWLLTS